MNYRYLLSLFFMALSLSIWAERIPESTARQVAQQVLSSFNPLRTTVSPVLAFQAPNTLRAGDGSDYYIYTPDQGTGFVIVAGDDLAYPILGDSTTDPFSADNMPAPMLEWLENYQQEMAHAKITEAPASITQQWTSFLRGETRLGTGKELSTPLWAQDKPFNWMTPTIEGLNTKAGCVAVAMGIIMGYHQYPQRAINTPSSQTIEVLGRPVNVQVDYSEPYDWSNILHSYLPYSYNDTQGMAVARLIYHCGVNVGMNYNVNESGALSTSVPLAMRDIFGYSPSLQLLKKKQLHWDDWKAMIRADIDEGLPLYYAGSNSGLGHAFVCDGYEDEYFHFNWGWGSYCNGYYVLSALKPGTSNFTSDQSAIFHLRPTRDGEAAEPILTVMKAKYTTEGTTVRGTCDVYYTGLDTITYKFRLGVVDSQNQILQSPAGTTFTHTIRYNSGILRDFTIELGRALRTGEKVVLLGSEDGQKWKILPTAPDVPTGVGPDGVITPPSDDPKDPEKPLYMNLVGRGTISEKYLFTTPLDNSVTTFDHTTGFYYHLSFPVDITFNYTIADYDQWKGKIAVYAGDDQLVGQAHAGIPVTIADDGTFSVRIPENEFAPDGFYSHWWKIHSSQLGQIRYSVEATADGYEKPFYAFDRASIHFVRHSMSSWESTEITGKSGDSILLKPTIPKLDPLFENKDLQVHIKVRHLAIDEYELYRSDGLPIPMKAYDNEPEYHFSTEPVDIWEQGKKMYDLVFVPKVSMSGDKRSVVYTTLYHKGYQIPTEPHTCTLTIQPGTSANEVIEDPSIRLSSEPGALVLHLEQDAAVAIYTMEGKRVNLVQRSAGDHRIPLAKGCYLVQINGQTYKIIL